MFDKVLNTPPHFSPLTANISYHIETRLLIRYLLYKLIDWFLYNGEHRSLTG